MKTFLVALVTLIVGAAVGGFIAFGVGTGVGVGTGLMVGICSTIEAAKDQGLVTAAQYDQVLAAAGAKVSGQVALPADAEVANSAAECAEVIAKVKQAAASGK